MHVIFSNITEYKWIQLTMVSLPIWSIVFNIGKEDCLKISSLLLKAVTLSSKRPLPSWSLLQSSNTIVGFCLNCNSYEMSIENFNLGGRKQMKESSYFGLKFCNLLHVPRKTIQNNTRRHEIHRNIRFYVFHHKFQWNQFSTAYTLFDSVCLPASWLFRRFCCCSHKFS